jgi:anti-sigma28 factor (negative regulator of flagellin synthesis)
MDINNPIKIFQRTQAAETVLPTEPVQPRKKALVPQIASVQQAPDQVAISDQAIQAQAMAARISSAPAARTDNADKLASVQGLIKANNYQVPAARVAEKLLLES